MLIIGCDFHPSFQEVAMVNTETGEERFPRLRHPEEAVAFQAAPLRNRFIGGTMAPSLAACLRNLLPP